VWQSRAVGVSAVLMPPRLLLQLKQRYKQATGHSPYIFEGSSPGAAQFGHLRIRRRPEQELSSSAETL
jgi:hypothetical protein